MFFNCALQQACYMGQMDFAENQLYIVGAIAFLLIFGKSRHCGGRHRADVSKANERAFAAAISVTGYRITMIVSGAGALIAQTLALV